MAYTVSNLVRRNVGGRREATATITFGTGYPTGGEILPPSALGMNRIESLVVTEDPGATRIVRWNPSTNALAVFTALNTQAANASNQTGVVVQVSAVGR